MGSNEHGWAGTCLGFCKSQLALLLQKLLDHFTSETAQPGSETHVCPELILFLIRKRREDFI